MNGTDDSTGGLLHPSKWWVDRHRESIAFVVASVFFIVLASYYAVRYQATLSERSVESAMLFGFILGSFGAGLVLCVAAVILAGVRVAWGRYNG